MRILLSFLNFVLGSKPDRGNAGRGAGKTGAAAVRAYNSRTLRAATRDVLP